jgi:MinD-like ATPase involved in chromosome partitioning or flagellar assembly
VERRCAVMGEAPRKLAFVSGKGGVGKTVLAANFAFLASTIRRTVLIDLDFQNQGASGLLAESVQPHCVNAFDLLTTGSIDIRQPVEVREKLFFIPSFDPSAPNRLGSQSASSTFQGSNLEKFARLLDDVAAIGGFDVLVIDCHGGLDDNSFAAFIYSDTTFVVTEPDKVTFNGTLELLDFYIERATVLSYARHKQFTETSIADRVAHIEKNKVRLLVNRVSDKFEYKTLKSTLSRQFDANVKFFQKMNEGFSFFPSDPLVSESFSGNCPGRC